MQNVKNDNYIIPVTRYISFEPKKLRTEEFGEISFEHKMLSGVIKIHPTSVAVNMTLNMEIAMSIEKMRKIIEEYDREKSEQKQ